jgi:hypothetical protein
MMLGWTFSFLAPLLTVRMLASMPAAPGLRQGLLMPLVIFVATTVAFAANSYLHDLPVVLITLVGLVLG